MLPLVLGRRVCFFFLKRAGAVNLGDGDYDGDELMICGWDKLLDFLDNTPSELSVPELRTLDRN